MRERTIEHAKLPRTLAVLDWMEYCKQILLILFDIKIEKSKECEGHIVTIRPPGRESGQFAHCLKTRQPEPPSDRLS